MDGEIASNRGYASRNEFIADAIQGHLAELTALRANDPRTVLPDVVVSDASAGSGRPVRRTDAPDLLTSLPAVARDGPKLQPAQRQKRGPTWGMHNRDFPTLWALCHLADATDRTGAPVPLKQWTSEVVQLAWRMAQELPSDQYDTSGFPSNPMKREAAEGRFVRFFLGTEEAEGPLFDLALVGSDEGLVAPTEHGLALLRSLGGFSCKRGQLVRRDWTEAYLLHLGHHAREDAEFMEQVLGLISGGAADRTGLIEQAGAAHPDWSPSVLETNVAGFIARGREWGLIRQKQYRGRYLLEEGALELVTAALTEASRPTWREET